MKTFAWLLACAAAVPVWAGAQAPAPQHVEVAENDPASAPVAPPDVAGACCRIAAGTAVELEIAEALGSAQRQRGDRFAIRLHAPLVHDTMGFMAGRPNLSPSDQAAFDAIAGKLELAE